MCAIFKPPERQWNSLTIRFCRLLIHSSSNIQDSFTFCKRQNPKPSTVTTERCCEQRRVNSLALSNLEVVLIKPPRPRSPLPYYFSFHLKQTTTRTAVITWWQAAWNSPRHKYTSHKWTNKQRRLNDAALMIIDVNMALNYLPCTSIDGW